MYEVDALRGSTVYDPAGHATDVFTRLGFHLTMQYDALGRLTPRIMPADTVVIPFSAIQIASPDTTYFPFYAQDTERNFTLAQQHAAVSVIIPADTATFQYDVAGNLTEADNHDARVTRAWNVNGTLASETQAVRTYSGTNFTTHVYRIDYGYDLEGRRVSMTHPAAIAPVGPGIGIAGGINVYGFASGDPITYADPYGLYIIVQGDPAFRRWVLRSLMYTATHSETFRKVYNALTLSKTAVIRFTARGNCSTGWGACTVPEGDEARVRVTVLSDGRSDTKIAHELFHAAGMLSDEVDTGVSPTCGNYFARNAMESCANDLEETVRKEVTQSEQSERQKAHKDGNTNEQAKEQDDR